MLLFFIKSFDATGYKSSYAKKNIENKMILMLEVKRIEGKRNLPRQKKRWNERMEGREGNEESTMKEEEEGDFEIGDEVNGGLVAEETVSRSVEEVLEVIPSGVIASIRNEPEVDDQGVPITNETALVTTQVMSSTSLIHVMDDDKMFLVTLGEI